MSSNRGLFRVAGSDLSAFFAGDSDRVRVEQFTAADGMPSSECNGGFQPPALVARDGRLWFPTTAEPTGTDPRQVGDGGRARPMLPFEEVSSVGRVLRRAPAAPALVPQT